MSWNITHHDHIAVVSFNRPPENRLLFSSLAELDQLLSEVGQDPQVSLVVLASDCPGYFSAGADISDIGKLREGAPPSDAFERWLWTLARLESLPQPVIAAIDGRAVSGGCEMALACTLRVGSLQAQFAQLEITRGAMPGAGGTQRLPRVVGLSRAAHIILTGRSVAAHEAHAIGLLDAILEGANFRDAVLAWAEPIASKPRAALVAAKQALVEGSSLPPMNGLFLEQRLFLQLVRKPNG
jgi:enoyl-CoA hydratase/carnithine racemase